MSVNLRRVSISCWSLGLLKALVFNNSRFFLTTEESSLLASEAELSRINTMRNLNFLSSLAMTPSRRHVNIMLVLKVSHAYSHQICISCLCHVSVTFLLVYNTYGRLFPQSQNKQNF